MMAHRPGKRSKAAPVALRAAAAALLSCGWAPLAAQARPCAPVPPIPSPGADGAMGARGLSDAERSRRVDALFAPWARRGGPGVAVLVVRRGQVVHMKGYGVADVATGAPITPRTRFDLASLSKQFTGMAVLQLVGRGELSYRDKVSTHLPQFAERGSGILVRDLLGHTSGIPDYISLFRARGPAYTAFPRAARGDSAVHEPTAAEMVDTLASRPLNFAPGLGWEYSNGGYLVAAAVVEKVSGLPWARYMEERIFRPAGMRASGITEYGTEDAPGRARSYSCGRNGWERADYTPLEKLPGAVGVVSTLEDLGRWYAALDASSLVAPEVQQEGFRTGYLEGGQPTEYGFGWIVTNGLGTERQAHGGWWKGFRNISVRYPAHGLTVAILSNDDAFAPLRNEMAFRAARLYLPASLTVPGSLAGPARGAARLAGTYVTGGRQEYRVQEEAGTLYVSTPTRPRLRLRPLADGSFYVAGNEEERYTFVPEPNRTGMRLLRMEPGLGTTVRSWTVAYRR